MLEIYTDLELAIICVALMPEAAPQPKTWNHKQHKARKRLNQAPVGRLLFWRLIDRLVALNLNIQEKNNVFESKQIWKW